MTTGTWNQDIIYSVFYKTNKSQEYFLFEDDLKTTENYELDFTKLNLEQNEVITEVYFDFGKVDVSFKETISPTMQCKSFETLINGECFTNKTKTVGVYFEVIAEANSEWTTIVHKPKEIHPPVLPRTGE